MKIGLTFSNLFRNKWFLLFVFALQLNASVHAQANKNDDLPFDANIKIGHLPNGFTYYIMHNNEPENRVVMYLVNKVGSILESDNQLGLAHFIEHMQFNGTTHFPKNELVSYLQKAGVRFGGDLNAFTSFDETVYQLPLPTDDPVLLKNGFQIMRDWAKGALLENVEIDKERGVILEEKRLRSDVSERIMKQSFPIILNNSRYAYRMPIGTEDVLKHFEYDTLRKFYNDWYRPDLQSLIVVGDINVDETEKTIVRLFSDLKIQANAPQRTHYKVEFKGDNHFFTTTDKELQTSSIEVMVKHNSLPYKTKQDFRRLLTEQIYNTIAQERLFDLTQQPNPPFLQAGSEISNFLGNVDMVSAQVYASATQMETAFKTVWAEVVKLKKYGVTESELSRAKDKIIQDNESVFNERDKMESTYFVEGCLEHFLRDKTFTSIDFDHQFILDELKNISLDDIYQLINNYWSTTNQDILVMGPDTDKALLPSKETLAKWMNEVETMDLRANIDSDSDLVLMHSQNIVPGQVKSVNQIASVGVTEVTLSNGIKLILKPTNFKNDEVLFQAYSPGGTSLYSDSVFQSALASASLVNNSGLDKFSNVDLNKILTGKNVNVTPYITERNEGFNGGFSSKDMETAFQMIYLYFTSPRKDKELFEGEIAQQKEMLQSRGNNPSAVYQDSLIAILGNYNKRVTAPSIEKINQINADKAFDIYKERFADASDFTFIFVGAFNTDSIIKNATRYFASLPALNRNEKATDLNIHIPAGQIEKSIYKGVEKKSTVSLVFSGFYDYSDNSNIQLEALAEVLNIKLIETLREGASGVYGVSVNANYRKIPQNRYSLFINFGCHPDNVAKLVSMTLQQIELLKKNGADKVSLEKFKAEQVRQMEVESKSNDFWISLLYNRYSNSESLDYVVQYQKLLNTLTLQNLKVAAQKYFNPQNFIQVVLYPEK